MLIRISLRLPADRSGKWYGRRSMIFLAGALIETGNEEGACVDVIFPDIMSPQMFLCENLRFGVATIEAK